MQKPLQLESQNSPNEAPKEPASSPIFNPFLSTHLNTEEKEVEQLPENKNNDSTTTPLNLSKPRKTHENEPNNNAAEKAFEDELEMLRRRKYFLDGSGTSKPGFAQPPQSPPFPHLFPTAAASLKPLHPGLFSPPPPLPPCSTADFPYPPFRNFPGFPGATADRTSAVAAAVGMLPPISQPAAATAAGLAALRNSSAAALGLHQVSMMDQVRQEHHRQQQQQSEDGMNCSRKLISVLFKTIFFLLFLFHKPLLPLAL